LRQLILYRVVREAQNAIAGIGHQSFAFGIPFLLSFMRSSIDLDRQPTFDTTKVEYKRSYRMLPAELQPVQATTAKSFPKSIFCRCLAGA
jgi:hypothetical protein